MISTPWTQSYPDGMRWDAELPLKPVTQFLDDAVARWPENPAIEFMGRVITYRELGELVDRAAKGFQALGVKPGDIEVVQRDQPLLGIGAGAQR